MEPQGRGAGGAEGAGAEGTKAQHAANAAGKCDGGAEVAAKVMPMAEGEAGRARGRLGGQPPPRLDEGAGRVLPRAHEEAAKRPGTATHKAPKRAPCGAPRRPPPHRQRGKGAKGAKAGARPHAGKRPREPRLSERIGAGAGRRGGIAPPCPRRPLTPGPLGPGLTGSVVASLAHLAVGGFLPSGESLLHRDLPRQCGRHLLADCDADRLKLRNGSELHACVGRRILGGV